MSSKPSTPRVVPEKSILVVDDDETVRTGLSCMLVTEGYEVIAVGNGREAEAAFRRHWCDLALVDMNMPIQNGWGTISKLRFLKSTLPVILLTTRPDQQTMARETGVELMAKPLDLSRLVQRIGELLNPPPAPV